MAARCPPGLDAESPPGLPLPDPFLQPPSAATPSRSLLVLLEESLIVAHSAGVPRVNAFSLDLFLSRSVLFFCVFFISFLFSFPPSIAALSAELVAWSVQQEAVGGLFWPLFRGWRESERDREGRRE